MPLQLAVRSRVVVDNDWAGDPDGLVALAHHLLSPTNVVRLVTSTFLAPFFGSPVSRAADGARLAQELVDLVGMAEPPVVLPGGDGPLDERGSAGADALVAEARRDDELPLFVVCGGPLTTVAQALRQAPDVVDRFTLVWIGGTRDPDAAEYNRDTDPAAAAFVTSFPGLVLWRFPLETYRQCAYSVAELEVDLGGAGEVGAWLWERYLRLPLPDSVRPGGVWPLGDSPPVLVTALDDASSTFEVTATGRDYTSVDTRLLVGDLLARLRLHERTRLAAT